MARRLSDDDARIVDLLLDSGSGGNGSGPALSQVFANPNPAMFEKRVEAVERILDILSMDPASEPPPDLVARTLERVTDPEAMAGRTSQGIRTGASQRPHA
jgi:hypothetical protein